MAKRGQEPRQPSSGFTLIELLLAAALIPIISFAIYANFSSGIRLWTVLTQQAASEDINLFYEKTSYDFKNAFHYTPILFTGEQDKLSFATRIDTKPSLGGDRGIGEVAYYYDSRLKVILRQEKNVSQIFRREPGQTRTVLKDVLSFQIHFFSLDEQTQAYQWKDGWGPEEKKLPLAIKINFETGEPNQRRQFIKTFEIPAGG